MLKIMTKFEVKDFQKWQEVFNENDKMRMDAGSIGVQVFRNVEDPNEVTVIMDWDDKEKTITFSQSAALREAQQKSGVISKPELYILQSM